MDSIKCKLCGFDDPFCEDADGLPHPVLRWDSKTNQMVEDPDVTFALPDHKDICCNCFDEQFGRPNPRRYEY